MAIRVVGHFGNSVFALFSQIRSCVAARVLHFRVHSFNQYWITFFTIHPLSMLHTERLVQCSFQGRSQGLENGGGGGGGGGSGADFERVVSGILCEKICLATPLF